MSVSEDENQCLQVTMKINDYNSFPKCEKVRKKSFKKFTFARLKFQILISVRRRSIFGFTKLINRLIV